MSFDKLIQEYNELSSQRSSKYTELRECFEKELARVINSYNWYLKPKHDKYLLRSKNKKAETAIYNLIHEFNKAKYEWEYSITFKACAGDSNFYFDIEFDHQDRNSDIYVFHIDPHTFECDTTIVTTIDFGILKEQADKDAIKAFESQVDTYIDHIERSNMLNKINPRYSRLIEAIKELKQ